MKKIEIVRSVMKQIKHVDSPKYIKMSQVWFDACSKVIKNNMINNIPVSVDKSIDFMYIKA